MADKRVKEPDSGFAKAEFVWSLRPSDKGLLPEERMRHSACQIGDKTYIFGGMKSDADHRGAKKAIQTFHDNLYIYDTATRKFQSPSLGPTIRPSKRSGHTAVFSEKTQEILVFGGVGGGNEVHKLNIKNEPFQWEISKAGESTQKPKERSDHIACVYGGKMLIFGGREKNGKNLHDMFSFDISNELWEDINASGTQPQDTSYFSGQVVGKFLYLVGAEESRTHMEHIHVLDLETYSWSEKKAKGVAPEKRRYPATCLHNGNQILLVGGAKPTSISGNQSEMPILDVHLLSVEGKTRWEKIVIKGHEPAPRFGHTVCSHGTDIFIFGGQTTAGVTNETCILVHQMWKPIELINHDQGPVARIGATCAVVEKEIYIIGGAVNGHPKNDVYVWNTEKNSWNMPAMYGLPPPALTGHCCTVVGKEIFLYGGGDGETPINDLYVIETVGKKWIKPMTEGTRPFGGVGCSMVTFGLKVIVYGGYGNRSYSGDVAFLDTATMTWSHPLQRGEPLPQPRVGHTAVMLGKSEMFVFGGSYDGKPLNQTWCLDARTMHWDNYQNRGDEGDVIFARFGHTAVAVGRSMYVFGGSNFQQKQQLGVSGVADYRGSVLNDMLIMTPNRKDYTALWSRPHIAGTPPEERYRHVMATFDGKIAIFSGSHGSRTLWILDSGHYDTAQDALALKDQAKDQATTEAAQKAGGQAADGAAGQTGEVDPQIQLMLNFLQDTGLSKYNRVFLKQEVDFNTLRQCTDQDLVDIGVTAIGPRKKILKQLAKLNATDFKSPEAAAKEMGKKDKPYLFALRYELLENKQTAGTATVRFAKDIRTHKEVVIKFVQDYEKFNNEIGFLRTLRCDEKFVVDLLDYEDRDKRKMERHIKRQRSLLPEEFQGLKRTASVGSNDSGGGFNNNSNNKNSTNAKPGLNRTQTAATLNSNTDKPQAAAAGAAATGDANKPQEFVPGTDIPLWEKYQQADNLPAFQGFHWMVLERGKMTLREFFKDTGVMYETQRKALFERILRILAHLNLKGVVHCDVKPENLVFFGDDMQLKLIDFSDAVKASTMIAPVATPSYCSPEMAEAWLTSKETRAVKKIKARHEMDVWAAGMIHLESYLGHPAFAGREDTYALLAKGDWNASLTWGLVDNQQALHLLQKILIKRPRPIASELLKTPYLVWGLDTIQINSTFGALNDQIQELQQLLEKVEKEVQQLQKVS